MAYLQGFERSRILMREVVVLPDKLEVLFVRVVIDNGNRLSQTKRARYFAQLSDEEVRGLETAIRRGFTPLSDENGI